MKRALVVAFNFPPSSNVGVFRTLRFCRFLPAFDWTTAVLTSLPDASAKLDEGLLAQVPQGVEVHQVPLSRPEDRFKQRIGRLLGRTTNSHAKSGQPLVPTSKPANSETDGPTSSRVTLRRKLSELLFAIPDDRIGWMRAAVTEGLALIERVNPNIVYATAPPFSALLVGRELARRAQLPLVLDFRDPWTRVPWGPRNKSWLANQMVIQLEKRCVRTAASVVLNTQQLEQDFTQFYNKEPREKFITIPNGIDPELKSTVSSLLQSNQRKSGELRLLHPGSMYRNRDPRPIVDALAILKKQGIPVVFEQLGYCEPSFQLQQYADQLGVGAMLQMQPPVAHADMLRRMAQADAFVLLQPGTGLQVPGKLFEMILFRKPIVAICEPGAVADIIDQYRIGRKAQAGDAIQIAQAIGHVQAMPPDGSRWEDLMNDFDGRRLTASLAEVFNRVVG